MDYPYQQASVAVNKQILAVILMLGNNAMLVLHQINTCCNANACGGTFHYIN